MEVNPEKQNINTLFSTTNYYIDFYQREYKWTDRTVLQLIEDIFYHFEQSYAEHQDLDPSEQNVTQNYTWYYLNTYITNKNKHQMFIVDGQQRLTTITLILIVLYHMCGLDQIDSPELRDWVKTKILGIGIGGKKQFWIANDKREPLMQALFDGKEPSIDLLNGSISADQIRANYELIQKELSQRLPSRHKLETFIYYFLCNVVIINLEVSQTDVPMVFEVINDRGVRLKPYEILKGKLLGVIDKGEVDNYTDIWDESLQKLEVRKEGEVDTFFRSYLRAYFSETRQQGNAFDGPYHRAIFDPKCNEILQLKNNPQGVKEFLKGAFSYYAKLFLKIRQYGDNENCPIPECYYTSQLNRMDGHIMLILAACSVDDPKEEEKIEAVCRAFDRAYVILQLNRAYDSNKFQEFLYTLHPDLHNCKVEDINGYFDKQIMKEITGRRKTNTADLLSYSQFKMVGYGDYNPRFLRYFLSRIELYISKGLRKKLQDSLHNYVSGTGVSTAYHVEHILARNNESRSLFVDENGEHDEELFENERNRFGGLLLLKGQDNSSSGAEPYAEKLKTYTGSAPYLAQTLVPDFYKSHSAMNDFIQESALAFEPAEKFTRETLENRSQLLYEITRKIWKI